MPTVLPMSPLLLPAVSLITLVKSSLLAVDEAWLVLAVDAFWACSALVETGSPDSAGKALSASGIVQPAADQG